MEIAILREEAVPQLWNAYRKTPDYKSGMTKAIPLAMGGFPRHESKRREAYHKAIRACVDDPDCENLANWIKSYIDIQMNILA